MICPARIGGTRWLPHLEKAINIFIRGYKVFLYQLDSAKAEGMAKMMRDGNLVVFMMSLKVVQSLPQLG